MSHDTQHGKPTEVKSIISFKNSFWLVIIIVGLFIAALNFVQVESKGGEEGHGEATKMHETHAEAAHEPKEGNEAKAEEPKKEEAAEKAAEEKK